MEGLQPSGIFINANPNGLGEVKITFDDETSVTKNITALGTTVFDISKGRSPLYLCIENQDIQIDDLPISLAVRESKGILNFVEIDKLHWMLMYVPSFWFRE